MTRLAPLVAFLLLSGTAKAAGQLAIEARVGYLDRRLADNGVVERQAGVVAGGALGLATARLHLMIGADGGALAAQTANTPDVDVGRATLGVAFVAAPWVRLRADLHGVVFVSEAGSQRWILPRFGVELRARFTSLPGAAYFAGAATLDPSTNGPRAKGGVGVRAGVEGGTPVVRGFVQYQIDRLSFRQGTGREEQWGEVVAGLRLTP